LRNTTIAKLIRVQYLFDKDFKYQEFSSILKAQVLKIHLIVGSDSPLPSSRRKQLQRESKLQRFEHRRGWAYHINHTTTILHVINRYKYISI
jgi:hypothetical protein